MVETLTTTLTWRCYEVEMVVMVRMVKMVEMVKTVVMVWMVKTVEMVVMVCQESPDQQAGLERRDTRGRRGTLAHLDLLAPAVEGWCTPAGDEQPALTHREQSWSMQEGLGGPSIVTKEEELTTSACLRVRTT